MPYRQWAKPMNDIHVRNRNYVVKVDNTGGIVAEAHRDGDDNRWYINLWLADGGIITQIAVVEPWMPEVKQRKVVQAILREL